MVLGRPVLLGRLGERVAQRAGQRAGAPVHPQLHPRLAQLPERARQEVGGGVGVHEQGLGRVADGGPLHLGVHGDPQRVVEVGRRVHEHVAVAGGRVHDGHRGVLLERRLQPLAAARDDQVDQAVLGGELAQLVAVAAAPRSTRRPRVSRPRWPPPTPPGPARRSSAPPSTSRAARSRCPTSGRAPSSRRSRSAAPRRPPPPRRAARARGGRRGRSRAGARRSSRPPDRAAPRSSARRRRCPRAAARRARAGRAGPSGAPPRGRPPCRARSRRGSPACAPPRRRRSPRAQRCGWRRRGREHARRVARPRADLGYRAGGRGHRPRVPGRPARPLGRRRPAALTAPITAQRPLRKRNPQVISRTAISASRPTQTPTIPRSNASDASAIGTNTPSAAASIPHIRKRVSPAPIRMPSSAKTAPLAGCMSANSGQISCARSTTCGSPVNACGSTSISASITTANTAAGHHGPLDHPARRPAGALGVPGPERAAHDHLAGDRHRVEHERQEHEQLERDQVRRQRVLADPGQHRARHQERPVERRGADEDLAADPAERAHRGEARPPRVGRRAQQPERERRAHARLGDHGGPRRPLEPPAEAVDEHEVEHARSRRSPPPRSRAACAGRTRPRSQPWPASAISANGRPSDPIRR